MSAASDFVRHIENVFILLGRYSETFHGTRRNTDRKLEKKTDESFKK